MNRTHTITLELLEAADNGLSGRARDTRGASREFSGRLGLMHTIDELLAAAGRTKEDPMNPTQTPLRMPDARALRRLIGGPALSPGDDGYHEARGVFNLTIDQRPALIAEQIGRAHV